MGAVGTAKSGDLGVLMSLSIRLVLGRIEVSSYLTTNEEHMLRLEADGEA